jgi:hypothetical protein
MRERRAHAADGHARGQAHALPGPAGVHRAGHHRDHSRIQGPLPQTLARGLTLFTVHVRRGHPDVQDPKLNSHSKLNCITACIQAYTAGADEALMLDPHGFVATCNSTHFFIVRRGEVWTSSGDYCLGGITRANVLAPVPRGRHPGAREEFQPDRGLRRRRSLRHRHLRRRGAGAQHRWPRDRASPGAGPMIHRLQALYRDWSCAMSPRALAGATHEHAAAHRDVVRAAQHLHRDDACLGEPRGLLVSDEPLYAHYLAHTGPTIRAATR